MTVERETFGRPGTEQTDRIRIRNANGSHIALIPVGARLVEVHVPDRSGDLADVVLGFDTVHDYLHNDTFAGSIAGRYANRITQARYEMDGHVVELEANEGRNHVHGGLDGLDRQHWAYQVEEPANSVTFTHRSPDGHGGYPGNLDISVTYRLADDDSVTIDMTATTDRATVLNLVNHSYWNLAGHASGSVLDHELVIDGPAITVVDDELCATGEIHAVSGTPFDFTTARRVGERIGDVPTTGGGGRIEAGTPGGYDHNWVLAGERGTMHRAAVLHDPGSGRQLTLSTTEAGVQVYTAGYMQNLPGKDGATYGFGAGVTFETQTFPCSPNVPWFPSARLDPGQTYRHTMQLQFGVRTS